jgi:hypothetical protein
MPDEKFDEKLEEKEMEKREEKWEEKWHRDPVSSVVGPAFLIWAGVVLLAGNMGFLHVFTDFLDALSIKPYDVGFDLPFFSLRAWQVFFLGGGVILLIEIVVRLLVPAYRRQVLGTFIGAIVLFALGLGKWVIVAPLIVIAVGVSILFSGLFRRR